MKPPSNFPSLPIGWEVAAWALDLQEEVPTIYCPEPLTQAEEDEYRRRHEIHEQVPSQDDFRYSEEARNVVRGHDNGVQEGASPPAEVTPNEPKVASTPPEVKVEEQKFELFTNEGSYTPPSCVRKPRSFFTPFDTAPLHLMAMRDLRRVVIIEEPEAEEREEREYEEMLRKEKAEKEGKVYVPLVSTSTGMDDPDGDKGKGGAGDKDKDKRNNNAPKDDKPHNSNPNPSPAVPTPGEGIARGPLLLPELRGLYLTGVPAVMRNCIVVYNMPPNYPYLEEFSALGDLIGVDFVIQNGTGRGDCVYLWFKNHLQAEYAARTMHNRVVPVPGPSSSKTMPTLKIGCWRLFDYEEDDEDKENKKPDENNDKDEKGAYF